MIIPLLKPKSKKKIALDAYKNNLVAGWSYYKLLSSYNGNCVRVRRSSDNAIQDFGFVKKKYINLTSNATITSNDTILNVQNLYDNIVQLVTGFVDIHAGIKWLKFDLGSIYNISNINIWHYPDGRTYHDVIIQISNDDINWITLFNNDINNSAGQGIGTDSEYAEGFAGKKLTLNQNARYVKLWSNGSTQDQNSHYTEVEILTYTNEWYLDIDAILAFCGTGNGYVHTWYNQFIGGNNAIQVSNSLQPMIIESGVFKYSGLYFNSSHYLIVQDYSNINFTYPNFSIYCNIKALTVSEQAKPICGKRLNISGTEAGWSVKLVNNTIQNYIGNGILGGEYPWNCNLNTTDTYNIMSNFIYKQNNAFVNNNYYYTNYTHDIQNTTNSETLKIGYTGEYFRGYIKTVCLFSKSFTNNINI